MYPYSKNEPNYKAKNTLLLTLMNKAEDIIYRVEKKGKLKSTSDVKLKE